MIAVNDVLGGYTLLTGLQCDGHTVFVAASHHHYIIAQQTLIAGVDVGRYIYTCEVPYVYGAVGIGKSGSYECTFEFLFHAVHLLYTVGFIRWRMAFPEATLLY